ncbi:MAG: hypothetical protein K5905_23070 [Roseibium sp.]|uniref:hypothetical protein n=1 Tax=Roseibium sp. TaxID=1936156 RepID=UPI0026246284|nr:hypothetical protein [Roseibium sp.]MCV0428349.1 hypothetical protein [Roseibium sp.]
MTVYVLHFDPPYRQARHYIGYTPDASAERRVQEHLSGGYKASPLVKAALEAGSAVTLAHEFPGDGRFFERWLKDRKDTRMWCRCCGVNARPVPNSKGISEAYRLRKAARDRAHGRAA